MKVILDVSDWNQKVTRDNKNTGRILSKEVFSLTAAEISSRPSKIKLTIRFKSAKILDCLDLI